MKKGSQQESPPRTKMTPSRSPSPTSHLSSTRSRSLSPYSKIETPTFPTRRQWLKHSDIMGESDRCLDDTYQDDKGDHTSGVRYITETLIKKLSKQENLSLVKSLNLSLSKYSGKKFKYIENLEKCNKLEVLNLSYNLIGKIEKLDKLLKLRELNLSYNKISKIEGLEHMQNLQKLNLAGNKIDHIPLWLGKKLRSLRVLNLKDNNISSLQEISKLKSLNDLTSLVLDGNPVVELPHYHLYTIFHLRSLESLEDQPVTSRDRQKSFDRFDLEEIERLERDLEKKTTEAEELKHRQAQFLEEMKTQNEINRSLKEEAVRHKHSYKELQSDLSTKSELLKQKTMELTRSCQKQYELEQELAFYKIDAKFEPLNYYPQEYNEIYDAPGESPYIGKSRYKRNMYTTESYINDNAQPIQIQKLELCKEELGNEQISRKPADTLDIQLKDKENKIKAAQAQLKELYNEMATVEQNILKATEEFKQLEEAIKLKKVSETEKDLVLKQLSGKIQLLNQLRQESMNLEMQMEKQSAEITKKEMEIKDVESALDNLDHTDPRHIHVKAQKKSREQQRDIMNKQYQQLESRLDDILTRIAKETDDIKDLEQQLTEGQIAANETLKKDLESIISGLQDYLENVKGQVTKVQDECRVLQNDKEILLQKVTKLEEEKSELEVAAMDAENMRKELAEMELLLQEHQEANRTLQQAQRDLSAYEVELETQLRAKEAESNQHKEELEKLKQLQELEHLTLQAELENERLALEEAFSKSQFSEKKEQENNELCSKIKQLEDDNSLLKQQLKDFQNEFDHMIDGLLHPEVAAARVEELKRKLEKGIEEIRCLSPSDVLGKSLADLQKQFNEILTHTQQEKEAALGRERKLQEEMAFQKEKLVEGQKDYRKACEKAADARIQSDKKQYEVKIQELENEILYLQENLKSMEEIQGFTDLQLQEADEEKERILTQLEDLENKKKLEEARSQKQFLGLDRELKELKAAVAASDKQATVELCIAKDQLKSLHGTVLRINQDRAERLQEAEHFSRQAAQAARDLTRAEAEIELLQNLLRQKEKQFQTEMEKVETGAFGSKSQMLEIEQLNEILKRQKTEIERLWSLLDQTGSDSKGEIESLVDEITELRRTLSHQNDYISSIADPFKRRGYWYFMPSSSSSKVSSPRSQSTKDSGIGLKYTSFNPVRKECGHDKQIEKKDVTSGCWIYSPVRSGLHKIYSNKGEGNREENELADEVNTPFVPPPGSVIYTVFPDGTPVPQGTVLYASPPPVPTNGRPLEPGTVVYGPPPPGTHIVYGPPPPHFSIPLIPIGVLHCNVPEHHNLENEISRLEDIVHHVKTKRQEDKAARQQTKREMEELHQNIEDLLNERKDLQEEMAEIHRNLQKYSKQKDFMEGRGDNVITELGRDASAKHHNQMIDEITCIESTLLKRRAELREADRLLAEAETELTNTKEKTKDTIQRYREVKTLLSWAELDAKELEQRAQETTINLMKADKQLRSLKVDGKDFKQNMPEQQEILKDPDFYSLSHKVEKLIEGLQKLQMDPEVPQGCNKDHHQGIGGPENLHTKRAELEKVKSQIAAQQQEMLVLDVHLTRKKEELHMLQVNVTKAKTDLQEAFNLRETEVAEKRNQLREIKSLLEELNFQKAELNVQISEKKTQLSLTTQEIGKEEEILHELAGQICRHKTEMKNFMDKLQHENNELQFLKVQRNQKMTELEKTQIELVQENLELEKVQRTAQRQREEVEWQRQLLEKEKQEISQLTSEVTTLQANVEALSEEKEDLEENCESLEKKLEQAKRMLAATEDSSRIATSNLERMELDVRKLQQEVDQLNRDKLSLHKDIANMQQHLQEKREELESLKDELIRVQDELKMTEEDLEVTSQHQSDLLSEQGNLKGNIGEQMKKLHECQEQEEKKQLQLQILQSEIEERKKRLAQEEGYLHQIQTEIENEEAKLEACKAKLKDQQQLLDWELASQKSKLEQVISKVALAEERVKTLKEEEKWSATLEMTLNQTRLQLSEREEQLLKKSSELLTLQQEMDLSKADISHLQSCFRFEKEKAEKQIIGLKEAIRTQRTQMEKALLDQKHENSCMQKEMTAVEQVAQDNHEQAKRLMKELNKIQFEYLEVQKQLKNQKDLEQRHKEISDAMKLLKYEVKSELKTSLKDFNQSHPESLEDLETVIKKAETLESELESLKENFPFSTNECQYSFEEKLNLSKVHIMGEGEVIWHWTNTGKFAYGDFFPLSKDEHWRGEAMREKLRHREDRLKAQLRSSMSRQTEALMKGKQQTEGTLHSLKRQVDALDELVTSNTADSTLLAPSLSQLDISLLEGSHLTKDQNQNSCSFQLLYQLKKPT
ncbi:centriolin isoform X2 [Monodelphis domestica]|uniref:centriolin isoform X2 n=1 Tax=Monodelphis domestica TaxID=13616 RepID=UPI0024E1E41B|nr:centriolin isoform X2 [Monodelphis domestica]